MLTVKTENKAVHWDLRQLCFSSFLCVFPLCAVSKTGSLYTGNRLSYGDHFMFWTGDLFRCT